MKIATYNINNVNRRLPNLLDWLGRARPDVVCLQELKAADDAFPEAELGRAGYGAVWRGQKTWNGVAILAPRAPPVLIRKSLPGDRTDTQSRYIEAAVNGLVISCLYLPNGNPRPGPKFAYKLAWFRRLQDHARKLLKSGAPVVLAGDSISTSTRWPHGRTTRWSSRRPAPPIASCSTRAGRMRCARFIPKSRCILSGTTSGGAGSAMPGCASIICYSPQSLCPG